MLEANFILAPLLFNKPHCTTEDGRIVAASIAAAADAVPHVSVVGVARSEMLSKIRTGYVLIGVCQTDLRQTGTVLRDRKPMASLSNAMPRSDCRAT